MGDNLNERVLQLQLINALTANNTDAVLATILKINNQQQTLSYGSPLHLVVSLSPFELVLNINRLTTLSRYFVAHTLRMNGLMLKTKKRKRLYTWHLSSAETVF